jgi:hypothetical protein
MKTGNLAGIELPVNQHAMMTFCTVSQRIGLAHGKNLEIDVLLP